MAQGGIQQFVGTTERVSALRGTCLVRDHHRCVISRRFDLNEAIERIQRVGDGAAKDDDGNLLGSEAGFTLLEVAHILPHSLTKMESGTELVRLYSWKLACCSLANPSTQSASRQAALAILNMFDSGVVHLIEGTDIDQPRNALTLTTDLHALFGDFRIYFTPTDQAHSHRIDTFLSPTILQGRLPVTRTLYLSPTRTIDPPSSRLLAIHRAIGHILHLSTAGNYIDKILRDIEEIGVRADGSTDLGRLLQLGLGGWLRATV